MSVIDYYHIFGTYALKLSHYVNFTEFFEKGTSQIKLYILILLKRTLKRLDLEDAAENSKARSGSIVHQR